MMLFKMADEVSWILALQILNAIPYGNVPGNDAHRSWEMGRLHYLQDIRMLRLAMPVL